MVFIGVKNIIDASYHLISSAFWSFSMSGDVVSIKIQIALNISNKFSTITPIGFSKESSI